MFFLWGDKRGNRLGMGLGFYDKLIRKLKCYKVAVTFDFQIVDKPSANLNLQEPTPALPSQPITNSRITNDPAEWTFRLTADRRRQVVVADTVEV